MGHHPHLHLSFHLFIITVVLVAALPAATSSPAACKSKCGSIPLVYPLGSGHGCGSPRFHPSITCTANSNQLLLTTHTGSYPVAAVDYAASTLTLSPPLMSTCTAMHPSPNFGLDWASPLQPTSTSRFLLLACSSPAASLTYQGRTQLCDASYAHLCAALYSTCPSLSSLGLPLFSPPTSCCVYSPANLGPHGDLDVEGLGCVGWTSVVSLGEVPTDPTRWEYGVVLKFDGGDGFGFGAACSECEKSDGVCGYSPPKNYFICVCNNGVNTSSDCSGQQDFWSGGDTTPRASLFFPSSGNIFDHLPYCSEDKLCYSQFILASNI